MFNRIFHINGHQLGTDQPCFIIAEAGVNHNGSLDMAYNLIDEAVAAGADAVKFQTFKAEKIVVPNTPLALYQRNALGNSYDQLDMLKKLELSYEAFEHLMLYCKKKRIVFMSSPFDEESANVLEILGVGAYKIPSGEITNIQLVEHIARKGKPVIMSTGMSTLADIKLAIDIIANAGNSNLAILHCVSDYPTSPENANLLAINTMAKAFDVPIGYSDHTLGIEIALAAIALGACIIEKHFTLNRNLYGPDHKASIEPKELKSLVRGIRIIEAALGNGVKEPLQCEADAALVSRKSIIAAQDIAVGTVITKELIIMKCPGTGMPPTMYNKVIGRVAAQDIKADTILSLEMFV